MLSARPVGVTIGEGKIEPCTTSYNSSNFFKFPSTLKQYRKSLRSTNKSDLNQRIRGKLSITADLYHAPRSPVGYLNRRSLSDLSRVFPYPRNLLEKYEIGNILGRGSFGVVREATDLETKKKYALKSIAKARKSEKSRNSSESEQAKQLKYLEKTHNEVLLMYELNDSADSVTFYGAYEDDTHVHLVLELLLGGTLQERLDKNGPNRERETARVSCAVVQFLAECHSRNIIYRDVKPENFMYSDPPPSKNIWSGWVAPRVKAIDFGQAVQMENRHTKLIRRSGTPAYMAPEVIRKNYDAKADLWSTGVMVYQLLTNKLPYIDDPASASLDDVWEAILHKTIDFDEKLWQRYSPDARDFVAQLLRRNPAARPSAADLLSHPWIESSRYEYKTDEYFW